MTTKFIVWSKMSRMPGLNPNALRTQRETILDLMANGRILKRVDLANGSLGQSFSQSVIARMIKKKELERVGQAGLRLWGFSDSSTGYLHPVAAAYGKKGGLITCHAALDLFHYGLVDESHDQVPTAVLLPFTASRRGGIVNRKDSERDLGNADDDDNGRNSRIRVRLVRTRNIAAFTVGVEERQFGPHKILVANPARALCDMFSKWASRTELVAEGAPLKAMVRVMLQAGGRSILRDAGKYATELGWGQELVDAAAVLQEAYQEGANFEGMKP